MFCVGIAQITVGFVTQHRFGLSGEQAATAAGIAMTLVGVALIAAQIAVGRIGWPPHRLISAGAAIAALGFGGLTIASSIGLLWSCFFLAGAGMGLVFPSFSALAANAVGNDEQGSAAGSVGAAQGLGMVCGPLAGAGLYGAGDALPYLLCLLVLAVVSIAFGRRADDAPRPTAG